MEKLAEGLVKLGEDDLLHVVQMIHDNKSEDTYTKNDIERELLQSYFSDDMLIMLQRASSMLTCIPYQKPWLRCSGTLFQPMADHEIKYATDIVRIPDSATQSRNCIWHAWINLSRMVSLSCTSFDLIMALCRELAGHVLINFSFVLGWHGVLRYQSQFITMTCIYGIGSLGWSHSHGTLAWKE
jgi:hypothetical protein